MSDQYGNEFYTSTIANEYFTLRCAKGYTGVNKTKYVDCDYTTTKVTDEIYNVPDVWAKHFSITTCSNGEIPVLAAKIDGTTVDFT